MIQFGTAKHFNEFWEILKIFIATKSGFNVIKNENEIMFIQNSLGQKLVIEKRWSWVYGAPYYQTKFYSGINFLPVNDFIEAKISSQVNPFYNDDICLALLIYVNFTGDTSFRPSGEETQIDFVLISDGINLFVSIEFVDHEKKRRREHFFSGNIGDNKHILKSSSKVATKFYDIKGYNDGVDTFFADNYYIKLDNKYYNNNLFNAVDIVQGYPMSLKTIFALGKSKYTGFNAITSPQFWYLDDLNKKHYIGHLEFIKFINYYGLKHGQQIEYNGQIYYICSVNSSLCFFAIKIEK